MLQWLSYKPGSLGYGKWIIISQPDTLNISGTHFFPSWGCDIRHLLAERRPHFPRRISAMRSSLCFLAMDAFSGTEVSASWKPEIPEIPLGSSRSSGDGGRMSELMKNDKKMSQVWRKTWSVEMDMCLDHFSIGMGCYWRWRIGRVTLTTSGFFRTPDFNPKVEHKTIKNCHFQPVLCNIESPFLHWTSQLNFVIWHHQW